MTDSQMLVGRKPDLNFVSVERGRCRMRRDSAAKPEMSALNATNSAAPWNMTSPRAGDLASTTTSIRRASCGLARSTNSDGEEFNAEGGLRWVVFLRGASG